MVSFDRVTLSMPFATCCLLPLVLFPAIDDPHKIVKVVASDGKSGETREICYSNCKVIGNGSFGVVYQAKIVGGSKDNEDIAIKKVLQDKRFKVGRLDTPLHYVRAFGLDLVVQKKTTNCRCLFPVGFNAP
jgi:hypothetical protein